MKNKLCRLLITFNVILTLLFQFLPDRVNAGDKPSERRLAGVIVGVIGVAVGAFIIYSIWKIADRIPAPQQPPAPPAPPPAKPTSSNKKLSNAAVTLDTGPAGVVWDITTYSMTNAAFWDADGRPYHTFVATALQSDSNGGGFADVLSLRAWWNDVNGISVCYSASGIPIETNAFAWSNGDPIVQGPNVTADRMLVRAVK